MANEVTGLTVKVGGDAIEFNNTIADVNKGLDLVKNELKNVNKNLKFDSKNVDLLERKFEAVESAVELTTTKLEQQQKELQDLGKYEEQEGTKAQKAWLNKQKQISNTQSDLVSYQQQLKKTTDLLSELEEDRIAKFDLESDNEIQKRLSELEELSGFKAVSTAELAGDAEKKINSIESELKDLDGKKATASVKIDSSQAQKALDDISGELDAINGLIAGAVGGSVAENVEDGLAGATTSAVNFSKVKDNVNADAKEIEKALEGLEGLGAQIGISPSQIKQSAGITSSYTNELDLLTASTESAIKIAGLYAIKEGDIREASSQLVTSQEAVRDAILTGSVTAIEDAGLSMDSWNKKIKESGYISQTQIQEIVDEEVTLADQTEQLFKLLTGEQRISLFNEQVNEDFAKITENLSGYERELFNAQTASFEFNSAVGQSFQQIGGAIGIALAPIKQFFAENQALLTTIIAVGGALAGIVAILALIGGAFTLVGVAISGITGIVGLLSGAFGLLAGAIGAVSLPVLLIGGAIVAVLAIAWNFKEEIGQMFQAIGEWATQLGQKISEGIGAGIEVVKNIISNIPSFLLGIGESIYNAFIAPFKKGFDFVSGLISSLFGKIGSLFSSSKSKADKAQSYTNNVQTTTNSNNIVTNNYYQQQSQKITPFQSAKILKGVPA